MAFYDICLTFADEVEYVWSRPRYTYMTFLFALNRYLLPLGYISVAVGLHGEMSRESCDKFVIFPGVLRVLASIVIGIIFIIRIWAIYQTNRLVTWIASVLLGIQVGLMIWGFADGVRLNLPPIFNVCILVGSDHHRFVFVWAGDLIFDSGIFLLTLGRSMKYYWTQDRRCQKNTLMSVMVKDGALYFSVILFFSVLNVSFYLVASEGLKAINASIGVLVTSLLVSRMTLNLRERGSRAGVYRPESFRDVAAHGPLSLFSPTSLAFSPPGLSITNTTINPGTQEHI